MNTSHILEHEPLEQADILAKDLKVSETLRKPEIYNMLISFIFLQHWVNTSGCETISPYWYHQLSSQYLSTDMIISNAF